MGSHADELREYRKLQCRRFPQHSCELPPQSYRVYPQLSPNASFWLRGRHFLQTWLVGWRKSTTLRAIRPSTYSLEAEQARHVRSRYWWVVHPYSRFFCIWQLVMIANVTFTIFVATPLLNMFLAPKNQIGLTNELKKGTFFDGKHPGAQRAMSYSKKVRNTVAPIMNICQSLYYFHIILLFVTGYFVPETGEVILQPGSIAKRYLTTWFIPDILSSVRFRLTRREHTFHFIITKYTFEKRYFTYFFNLVMLMRFAGMRFLLSYTNNWCQMFGMRRVFIRITMYFICLSAFITCAMILSYVFPALVTGSDLFRNDSATQSWIMNPDLGFYDPNYPNLLLRQVLLCLYRTVCTISQAIPYTTNDTPRLTYEDYVWLLITMWSGSIFRILLISMVLEYAESIQYGQVALEKVMYQVRAYMRDRDLPMHVRQKMLLYYGFRFHQDRFFHERAILAHLPPAIRNSVRQSVAQRLISGCALFRGVPKALINSIVAALEEVLYLPNDVVYASGGPSLYLFFLNTGTVGVYLVTGEEVCHLEDGASFGEMGLTLREHHRRHVENVVALEVCEVFRLSRRSFEALVKPMPRLYNRIRAEAMLRAAEVAPMTEDDD